MDTAATALRDLLAQPDHVSEPLAFPWVVQHASAMPGEGPFIIIDLEHQRFKVELYHGWTAGVICDNGHFHLEG